MLQVANYKDTERHVANQCNALPLLEANLHFWEGLCSNLSLASDAQTTFMVYMHGNDYMKNCNLPLYIFVCKNI